MLISLNRLKKYISLDKSADEISETLTSLGIEVEEIQVQCGDITGVVVGEVLQCEQHPDADKLSVCQVADGTETVQVVCGAPNVAKGQKVVFAQVGAVLKEGFKIKKSKIRGVVSLGMICAEDEIGLGESHDGIIVLPENSTPGAKLQDIPNFCDTVLELSITPNRPDALSYLGVTRELAAYYKTTYQKPALPEAEPSNAESDVSIKIEAEDDCSLYTGVVIKNVKVGPSPDWLVSALNSMGLNPINNVVDLTNYVLFETGHPSHAFDLNKISGRQVIIRRGKKGESFVTLDEEKREIDERDLVIADPTGPICLAGVIGGDTTKVDENTTDLLLEVAYFNPPTVRQQAKRHAVSTDSSYRFERGVNPLGVRDTSDYLSRLLAHLTGGTIVGPCIESKTKQHPNCEKEIELRFSRLKKIMGIEIPEKEVLTLLNGIEIQTVKRNPEKGSVTLAAPGFRPDLEREVDLIEEVARLYNFNNIPAKLPKFQLKPVALPETEQMTQTIRHHLVSQGLYDCLSLRFTAPKYIQWLNPGNPEAVQQAVPLLNYLSEEWQVMPTSPLIALLNAVRNNQNNQEKNCALFEVAKSFSHIPDQRSDKHPGVKEEDKLVMVICGDWKSCSWEAASSPIGYYQIKGILENLLTILGKTPGFSKTQPENSGTVHYHPAESAIVSVDDVVVGALGMLHPQVQSDFEIKGPCAIAELSLNQLLLTKPKQLKFKPFGHYSAVTREINIVVDEKVSHQDILSWMPLGAIKNLTSTKLNSIYQGKGLQPGTKAMHYSFTYRNNQKTLTDKEVNKAQERLAKELAKRPEISFK